MYTSFSTTSFYKDINTLQELDDSGLPIGTSSRSLLDIFGDRENPLLASLQDKFIIMKTAAYDRAIEKRDVCCVERKSDITVGMTQQYLRLGYEPLHIINECPRTYFLSFIIKKHWPFRNRFNEVIQLFLEAGMIDKWYADITYALVMHDRMNATVDRRIKQREPLTILDIQTPFFFLFIGMIVSFVIFCIEVIINYHTNKLLTTIH